MADTYSHGMFVLKGGNSFSAYLWDGLSTSGQWDVQGLGTVGNGSNTPDLSHFSFYGFGPREVEPPAPTVPEPATMLGLVAVGASMVLHRKKKGAQA